MRAAVTGGKADVVGLSGGSCDKVVNDVVIEAGLYGVEVCLNLVKIWSGVGSIFSPAPGRSNRKGDY
jgi:hypothetical protein